MSVMKEMKNTPKFSAKAVAIAEKRSKILFFTGLFFVFGGASTIEAGSLGAGLVMAIIGIAAAFKSIDGYWT
ncbi:MAG: hypothetical protein Q7S11_04880 [bacterium]|nr:hypothetical protein [bacterium]